MSEITTLTGDRSNQPHTDQSATLDPLGRLGWSRLRPIDDYYTGHLVPPTTIGDLSLACETSIPCQEQNMNPRLSDLTVEINADQLRIRGTHELQYSGIVDYIGMGLPKGGHSSIGALDKLDDASELQTALDDLAHVREEAQIEQFPIPPQSLVDEAERLIRKLYSIYPARYEVSADPDGAVAIDVRNGCGQWILLLCEPDGGALVLTNLEIDERRRYPLEDEMLDSFLRNALDLLKSGTP